MTILEYLASKSNLSTGTVEDLIRSIGIREVERVTEKSNEFLFEKPVVDKIVDTPTVKERLTTVFETPEALQTTAVSDTIDSVTKSETLSPERKVSVFEE